MARRKQAPKTEVELRLARILQRRVREAVAAYGDEWVAARIGFMPATWPEELQTDWPIATAVHFAAVLDVLTDEHLDVLERSPLVPEGGPKPSVDELRAEMAAIDAAHHAPQRGGLRLVVS